MARSKGTGSIYERADGKWVAQLEHGVTHSGKRRYLRRVRPNESQAKRALDELERMVARNLEPGDARQTLTTYLDGWVDGLEGVRAPKTIAAYRADVAHVKEVIGKTRLDKLTPNHVRQLMKSLPKRGLAPKSCLNVRTTLHTAIEQAMKDRILEWNPVSVVDRPRVERQDIVPLTAFQARQVLDALADDRLYALYAVGVAVGLRLSEALGLTWDRIDLDTGIIQVRRQVQRIGKPGAKHYALVELKSKKSRRDIPLPEFAVAALRRHKYRQNEEKVAADRPWTDGCCEACGTTGVGLVFTTNSHRSAGRPIHPTQALKYFQDICETAVGFRPRFHDLRHTAATLLMAQGVPLAEIQDILGHSSITVTKDLYGHLDVEHLRGAATKMDELFG
jgi:integrase